MFAAFCRGKNKLTIKKYVYAIRIKQEHEKKNFFYTLEIWKQRLLLKNQSKEQNKVVNFQT